MKKYILLLLLPLGLMGQTPIPNTSSSFYPLQGGKYIVSGWVLENHTIQPLNYTSVIKITTDVTSAITEFAPSGEIIDGWQRIVGIITIPTIPVVNPGDETNGSISIELVCKVTGVDAYFDDIRFFPYNGNLKSFVYDEATQRLMAELDENNYATFYEYDLEGGLVRVKKETEQGVFTIQETRSNNPKKD
jgi:hypothetical protein